MAFQVGASCYGSAPEAVAAIASSQVGAVVQHGGAAYVVNVPSLTGSSITYNLQPLAGGSPISYTAAVTPQPCGLMGWEDALALSWAIATAWIATAVVLHLRKAAHE